MPSPFYRALPILQAGGGPSIPLVVPTDYSGLILWMDGADTGSITGTTQVTQWSDKSGNDLHFTNSTGSVTSGTETINSRNALGFGGGADLIGPGAGDDALLDFNGDDWTVIGVAEFNGAGVDYNNVIGKCRAGTNNGRWALTRDASPEGVNFLVDVGSTAQVSTASTETDTPLLMVGELEQGVAARSFKNSTTAGASSAVGTAAAYTYNDLCFIGSWTGTTQWDMNGKIAEIVIYNRILTSEEKTALFGALATKWGITLA